MTESTNILGAYRKRKQSGQIRADQAQELAIEKFALLARRLANYQPGENRSYGRGWFGFGYKAAKPQKMLQGIYIYGGVGRGKSMLMDLFFAHVAFQPKQRIHFHAFMQDIHRRIKQARQDTPGDPIPIVAKKIAKQALLLCFDEFHVTDIADAMILGRLFTVLFAEGVIIVATSNRAPDELYQDGINRQVFLPFIALLKQQLDILHLDAGVDYRLERLEKINIAHTPLNAATRKAMDAIWLDLTRGEQPAPAQIIAHGREWQVGCQAMGVMRADFAALCGQNVGAGEYLAMAEKFHTLMIDDIPAMSPAMRNEAKRFNSLIDILYEARCKLVFSAAARPEEIYQEGSGAFEFARTVSRIAEMGSQEYLALGHVAGYSASPARSSVATSG